MLFVFCVLKFRVKYKNVTFFYKNVTCKIRSYAVANNYVSSNDFLKTLGETPYLFLNTVEK